MNPSSSSLFVVGVYYFFFFLIFDTPGLPHKNKNKKTLSLSLSLSRFSRQERQDAEAKAASNNNNQSTSPSSSRHNDSTSSNLLGASDSWGSGFPSPVAGGSEKVGTDEDDDYLNDDSFDETGIEVEMEVADVSQDSGDDFF